MVMLPTSIVKMVNSISIIANQLYEALTINTDSIYSNPILKVTVT